MPNFHKLYIKQDENAFNRRSIFLFEKGGKRNGETNKKQRSKQNCKKHSND